MCDHVVVSFSGGLLTVDGCLIQVPRLARCAAFLVESDQAPSAYCAKLGSRLPWDGVRNDGEASEDTSKSRCRVDCSSPCAVTVQRRTRSSGPARLAPAVEVAGTGASRRRWCELRTRCRCAEEQHALRWVHQEVWAGVPGDASELGGEGRRRAGGRRGGPPAVTASRARAMAETSPELTTSGRTTAEASVLARIRTSSPPDLFEDRPSRRAVLCSGGSPRRPARQLATLGGLSSRHALCRGLSAGQSDA